MKITKVVYHALFNLGDYENERIELSAQLEDGETPEDIIPKLRERTAAMAQPNSGKVWENRSKLQRELYDLEKKVAKARQEWDATAEFLRAQGIKADAHNMPEFAKLLNPVVEEHTEVVDGELDSAPY